MICPIDGAPTSPALEGRPDYEFAVPARLDYQCCVRCGTVSATNIPEPETISSFYRDYTTHGTPAPAALGRLGRQSRRITLSEFDEMVSGTRDEALLDYGCGDGSFLVELRNRGYSNLAGYDFDPQARDAAKASGAVIHNDEETLAAGAPYGTIVLNHVVEHLADPAADIARLAEMLRPGGRLIMRTPNARSLLSRIFGTAWRGWETPRHLHVFTKAGVKALAATVEAHNLHLVKVTTSEAMFMGIFHGSAHGQFWRTPVGKILRHATAMVAFAPLTALTKVLPVGEELVVVFERGTASATACQPRPRKFSIRS